MNITGIVYMIIFSIIIGYITMPIILGFYSKYHRNNLNKLYGAIFMALFMGAYECISMRKSFDIKILKSILVLNRIQ